MKSKTEKEVKEITGQTSDQNVYVLPEVEEGYKPVYDCKTLSEFFTVKDFAYLLKTAEKQFEEFKNCTNKSFYSSYGTPFYQEYKKKRAYIYPQFKPVYSDTPFDELVLSGNFLGGSLKVSQVREMGYEAYRALILEKLEIYEFPEDVSVIPKGVDEFFIHTCEKIDKQIENAQESFELTCCYLNDIKGSSDNFKRYGVKDIYEFAERRFGIKRTSTKNFLNIYQKFMDGVVLKKDYIGYSSSQLMELLPVDAGVIKSSFNPKMSVKEIREKKKELCKGLSSEEEKIKPEKKKNKSSETIKLDIELLRGFFNEKEEDIEEDIRKGYLEAINDIKDFIREITGTEI